MADFLVGNGEWLSIKPMMRNCAGCQTGTLDRSDQRTSLPHGILRGITPNIQSISVLLPESQYVLHTHWS